jgi:hypothetical protein
MNKVDLLQEAHGLEELAGDASKRVDSDASVWGLVGASELFKGQR